MGITISVIGLALAVESLALLTVGICQAPGGCRIEFHWPTLWTGFGMIVLGIALVAADSVSRRHRGA